MAINTFLPGTISNWGSTTSWSLGTVPLNNGDTIVFTASSATCSLNVNAASASIIDFKFYNKEFRFNSNSLLVYGNLTLGNQMSFSYSSAASSPYTGYNLAIVGSSSITNNGFTISVPTIFYNQTGNNNFYTLNDNMVVSENFSTGSPNTVLQTQTINGATLSLGKSFAINTGGNLNSILTTGTSNIVMYGTGNLSSGANTIAGLGNNFTINPTANITFTSNIYYKTGTFSVSGSPTLSGAFNLYFTGASSLIAASSSSTYILNFGLSTGSAQTVTLLSNIHSLRGINSVGLILNGFNYYIYGNSLGNNTTVGSGTTVYYISGTSSGSSVSMTATTGINNNIVINSPGSVTFTSPFYWSGTSFVYTAGNVSFASVGTFNPNFSNLPVLDTNGMVFLTFQPTGNAGTMSLNSQLTMTSLIFNSNVDWKFTGSAGWTTQTLQYSGFNPLTARQGIGLAAGLTYTVTATMSITPASNTGNIFGIRSLTPGVKTNFVFTGNNQQTNIYMIGDNVDSSGGNTIWIYNYQSTTQSTNTTNWANLRASNIQSTSINIS